MHPLRLARERIEVVPVHDDVGATPFGFDRGVAQRTVRRVLGVDLHGKADRSGQRDSLMVGYETLGRGASLAGGGRQGFRASPSPWRARSSGPCRGGHRSAAWIRVVTRAPRTA